MFFLAFSHSDVHSLLCILDQLIRVDDVLLQEFLLWDELVLEFLLANADTDLCFTLSLLNSILDGIMISQRDSVIILFCLDLETQVIIHVLKRYDEFIQWTTS